jgi:hypothetical protein
LHNDGVELAKFDAHATTDTPGRIDGVGLFFLSGNTLLGAGGSACPATRASFGIDAVSDQVLAYTGGALMAEDVGFIFIAKVSQGGQDRIGSAPA